VWADVDNLTGTVERIVYQNDDNHWTVARIKLAEAPAATRYRAAPDLTTVVGNMPGLNVGETVLLNGEWQINPQHGRQFRVETFEPQLPNTVDGIRRYLGSGLIKGVGPKIAERIVEHFGADTLDTIDHEPARLAEVPGISHKKLGAIMRAWSEQKDIKNLMLFLQSHEVQASLAARIYKAYGAEAVTVIRDDPYRMAKDVYGVGFITADGLAQKLGLPAQSPQRHVAGLRYALSKASDDGHVFLPRRELIDKAVELLGATPEDIAQALDGLTATQTQQKGRDPDRDVVIEPPAPDDPDGEPRVYLSVLYYSERGAARRLRMLAETPSTLLFARNIDWERTFQGLEGKGRIELAAGQRVAVQTALSHKVSVLTGGPGVGKTTTLRAVLHLLERYGIRYCLAAPTGRAAKRMSEATGREAHTIHRLLEFSPGQNGFAYNEENPLPYSFVVVDESSMIDIFLFYGLLKAVAPTAHLLLVGDADQLPSVGPGNVLRDVISSEALPVTRLTELFRQAQGSRIITTAHAINQGRTPRIDNPPDTDLFFIREDDPDRVIALLKTVVSERAPKAFGLDPLADVQIISPSNKGQLGVHTLNELLQELLNPEQAGELHQGQRVFRVGDKVMQIRNNYNKNVFNGDMGRVARVDREEQLLVIHYPAEGLPVKRERDDDLAAPARGRGRPAPPIVPKLGVSGGQVIEVAYEFHETDELTHAYAVSVHKSQGSEFPAVVMPLSTSHYLLLQRNLIYTAITRARRLCVLIGSQRALDIAVHNNAVDRRYTALAERLRAAPIRTIM